MMGERKPSRMIDDICIHCGSSIKKINPAWLRRARKERGISLRALAKRLHISAAYLSDIELGRRGCPAKLLEFLERL